MPRRSSAITATATMMAMAGHMGRQTVTGGDIAARSELRALDVVAEHLAHGVADLALRGVRARAIQNLRHHVLFPGSARRRGGERLERRRARLVVARAPQLREDPLLVVLDGVRDGEDRDVDLLVGCEILV